MAKIYHIEVIEMTKFTKAVLAGALSLGLVFGAAPAVAPELTPTAHAELATHNPSKAFEINFKKGKMPRGWEASHGWTNGYMFYVNWYNTNVTFNNGLMQLIIDRDPTKANNIPYSGGEFRSKNFYGYGRYEVCMKAIKNDGVVSSFFTYTGPSDSNPWDEIDIEILGKDTTKVQFNFFRDSKGEHEHLHDLGFDASEDFHVYGFEWHKDRIVWFVDGQEVYSYNKDIPVTKSKIMMNAWAGITVDEWLKPFKDKKLPIYAEYQWVKFTPFENE
jgi:endoglucanase